MVTVDDATDPAHGLAQQRPRAAGVQILPEGFAVAAAPDVGAQDGSEEAAPLADPALVHVEHPDPVTDEPLVVLPDEEQAGPDQAGEHHPDGRVGDLGRFDAVVPPGHDLAEPTGGYDSVLA